MHASELANDESDKQYGGFEPKQVRAFASSLSLWQKLGRARTQAKSLAYFLSAKQ
jgi:hypothetical protein